MKLLTFKRYHLEGFSAVIFAEAGKIFSGWRDVDEIVNLPVPSAPRNFP
jgi:hypothetical protein